MLFSYSRRRLIAVLLLLVGRIASRVAVAHAREAVIGSSGETRSTHTTSSSSNNNNNMNDGDGDFDDNDDDSFVLSHFVAHNKTMTCSSDEHARPFNNQIRGVNLGGWMVLEPWITPSLFYQFLGGDENSAAFDMYTFCETLGAAEGNQQLRRHWETWVTKDIIQKLAQSGAVNSFRLPLGDFQFVPYGGWVIHWLFFTALAANFCIC